MTDRTLVLDTPGGIEGYRLLATLKGLEMEVKFQRKYGTAPTALPTRGMALGSARAILAKYKVPGPSKTRAQCLAGMRQLCQQLGLTNKESE